MAHCASIHYVSLVYLVYLRSPSRRSFWHVLSFERAGQDTTDEILAEEQKEGQRPQHVDQGGGHLQIVQCDVAPLIVVELHLHGRGVLRHQGEGQEKLLSH